MNEARPARRVLVIGDPHARAAALAEFEALAAAVLDHCRAVGPERYDYVVVTGDLLHDHAYVHTAPYNAVLDFVRSLAAFARRGLYLLIGNHDLVSNQVFLEPKHAFNAVKDWQNVHVVDRVIEAEGFVFLPYVPPGRFVEALDGAGATGPDWRRGRAIFAHQEFRGARSGHHVSEAGDLWSVDLPLVVSGHFHAHHWLLPNLCYVGAPASHDFGDEGEHGLSVFAFEEDGSFVEKRIALGLPRRVTRECALDEAESFAPEPGTITRLIVTGDAHALLAFRKSAAYRALGRRVAKLVLRAVAAKRDGDDRPGATYMSLLTSFVRAESELVREAFERVRAGGVSAPFRPTRDVSAGRADTL